RPSRPTAPIPAGPRAARALAPRRLVPWEAGSLASLARAVPPPGSPGGVLDDDALGGELSADLIGLGEPAGGAQLSAQPDLLLNVGVGAVAGDTLAGDALAGAVLDNTAQ